MTNDLSGGMAFLCLFACFLGLSVAFPSTPLAPPSAVLTANTVSVPLKKPFSVTCTLENVPLPLPANYSVRFHSQRDGLLASVVVTEGAAPLLLRELITNIDVSPGNRDIYPTFDLELTGKVDTTTAYWCSFEEPVKGLVVKSDLWPQLVSFTSSQGTGNEHLGVCHIGKDAGVVGETYSVRFLSNVGPVPENLLARYAFKANRLEEFDTHVTFPWSQVKHGQNTAWPSFTILVNSTETLIGQWWCALEVGVPGATGYRQLFSNKEELEEL